MIQNIKTFFNRIAEKFTIEIFSLEDFSINLFQLIAAAAIFIIGIIIIRFVTKKIRQWKYLTDLDQQHQSVSIVKLIRLILYILLIIAFFAVLGFPVSIVKKIWEFSLFSIKENSISLGNLIIGITFFVFAFRINKIFKPKTAKYIDHALDLDFSTHKTILTIIEYIFVLIIMLFSLSIIGIPLTAFTVIGGSLAIGVGLGSQNLINNFISGFVLMGEGTTKIGDIIEIEGNIGTVEKIGFRSTIIKTFSNLRLIMPNSSLLENNVINWSLTDKILRRKVTVGVAYGADAVRVQNIFQECAKARNDINKSPEPFVIFSDFGDSALIFDIYIFIDMTTSRSSLNIGSDLRTDIYQALAKEKIGIPFPQRDNHIFINKPIDVNLKNEDKK